jgi:hypothetical protein
MTLQGHGMEVLITMSGGREVLCYVWMPGMMLTWVTLPHPDPRKSVAAMRKRAAENPLVQRDARRAIEARGSGLFKVIEAINAELSVPKAERVPPAAMPWWKKFAHEIHWNWYGAQEMIAECLGAPEPAWDEKTGTWWQDHEHHLAWVQTAADISRIKVPDWQSTAPVAKMLAAYERWNLAFPDLPAASVAGPSYPSFADTGPYVVGTTRFFTLLGDDSDLADALMDKCFELTWSYADFIRSLQPANAGGPNQLGLGGDTMCILSPQLYEKYGIGSDIRLFEYFKKTFGMSDAMPCNLHSCGPSVHLYDSWSRHPYRHNVTTMQTCFIPGQVRKLRECLPDTMLELTFHPNSFDFAGVSPDEVRQVIWQSVRDAGFRDLSFTVLVAAHDPADIPRIETNLQACYEAVTEVNRRLEAGAWP